MCSGNGYNTNALLRAQSVDNPAADMPPDGAMAQATEASQKSAK
ncbi:hypothetical protein [Longitalea luteola]|nr:hypothetical protein [Longitalea luteola]